MENSLPAKCRLPPNHLINVIEFLSIYTQKSDCRKIAASHSAHLPSLLLASSTSADFMVWHFFFKVLLALLTLLDPIQPRSLTHYVNQVQTRLCSSQRTSSCLFIYFSMFRFSTVLGHRCCVWIISSCGKQGPLSSCSMWASYRGSFSSCGAWAPGQVDTAVGVHRFSCPAVYGVFLDQGSKPYPSQGGFLTTGPLGKSRWHHLKILFWL